MKHTPFMVRQGDVMVREPGYDLMNGWTRDRSIPGRAVSIETQGRAVLAYGESSGHAHALYTDRVRMFRADDAGQVFLRVDAESLLKHEEHTALPVPVGDYEVVRQVEYTPAEIRRVED